MKVKTALGVVVVGVAVTGSVVCGGLYYMQDGTTGEPVAAEAPIESVLSNDSQELQNETQTQTGSDAAQDDTIGVPISTRG